jgi:DNA topoisomerase-1
MPSRNANTAPRRTHGRSFALLGRVTATAVAQLPVRHARAAGLRYTGDDGPGITRVKVGKGVGYRDARGRPVRDAATLARIRSLVIPPAWTGVWICPSPHGHIQATGRDAKGRKQYRYHPRWIAVRDEAKFDRLEAFGRALPELRRRTRRDLLAPPLSRRRVLATVLSLLETTCIRIGNDEYARTNGSYGLTTLQDRHVEIRGPRLRFRFRAKSGVLQTVDLHDARLARIVKRCQDLPGQTLFQYVDDNGRQLKLGSSDVNAYVRDVTGHGFTAKDLRTWAGTVDAACALADVVPAESVAARKRQVVAAIDAVSARLGNTRAVCRRCYIHPAILDTFLEGHTIGKPPGRPTLAGLSPAEVVVLNLLAKRKQKRVRRQATRAKLAA